MKRLVGNFLIVLLALASGSAYARSSHLVINGQAVLESGGVVGAADILLLEGHFPRPGELPSFTPFARVVTNSDGSFSIEVPRKKAIIVELIRDRCEWFGVRASIDDEEIKNKSTVFVRLVTSEDVCR